MATSGTTLVAPPQSPRSNDVVPAIPGDPISADALADAGVGAGAIGSPVEGPSGGPTGDPGGGPTPTPDPTPDPAGGGTPTPTPAPGGSDSGGTAGQGEFTAAATTSFLDLLKNATSPEALEAQNIILRRIALQGDVIPSRVPPPRNITEIGGYLNLLTTLNELDMRSQVLAGILGVAGPNPPLGWVGAATPLTFTPLLNDRPVGPLQPGLPVTIMIRSDFAAPLRSAIDTLHESGAMLPMMNGPLALPPAGGYASATLDPLDYLGRTLRLSVNSALSDPATDVLALARTAGSTEAFDLAARGLETAPNPPASADYEILQRSPTGTATVNVSGARLVMVGPLLAEAGFIPASLPVASPSDADSGNWSKYRNIGGLAVGTRLGDELHLLHSSTEIAGSALSAWQSWRWNGNEFAP